MTFLVQQNSSAAVYYRKILRDPYLTTTIPMQVAAESAIAREILLRYANRVLVN